ncbi:hypothetical protein ILYODFUR_025850 [Ilyodon furcidens]|uniref:Uncharacterized protein n=1 Tax=Ilyodon furcidens TaxID=33524 RepID=A0ABV0TPK2_9TELE
MILSPLNGILENVLEKPENCSCIGLRLTHPPTCCHTLTVSWLKKGSYTLPLLTKNTITGDWKYFPLPRRWTVTLLKLNERPLSFLLMLHCFKAAAENYRKHVC